MSTKRDSDVTCAAFEVWISAPPFERSTERQGENGSWPGQYRSYETQSAWEAWQESAKVERERCIEEVRGIGGRFALEAESAIRAIPDEDTQ